MNVKEKAQIIQEFSMLSAHFFHKSKTFYLKNCYFKCASFLFVDSTWDSSCVLYLSTQLNLFPYQ